MGLAPSLLTQVRNRVRKLQRALYVKAKTEPDFRFYSQLDKVYRIDVLVIANQRCRANRGSYGVDGQRFDDIESMGPMEWLAQLREELKSGGYRPQPLRRVWIPKKNGKLRSLGIPCIRDRVVQMAVNLTLQAIFEADMQPSQYGFRPRRDAKEAVRQVHHYTARIGLRDVVDTDLRDYFSTIPHWPLMKCLARRISDCRVLRLVKQWLEVAVIELIDGKPRRTNEAKHTHRGSAQGSVISPLLANVYFRRFILAWEEIWLRQTSACKDCELRGRHGDLLPARQWRTDNGADEWFDGAAGADGQRRENGAGETPGTVTRLSGVKPGQAI